MKTGWQQMSATALGKGIGTGEIDPVTLTEAFLDAINQHQYRDRIYARSTGERALSEATAARDRARAGTRRGPLDGVPISWKDLFDTANTLTEAGSALLKGRMPTQDAVVLQNATRAGLVCLGKTHMTELAFSGLGLNPVTATPPNINGPALAPGGSSSGAATSVAFGLAAAGIGSDTGGSVRIPAAWNNLVGLKTTAGLLSLTGVVPLCSKFDTIGPLCRSVEDAAHLLAAMGGPKAPDLAKPSLHGTRLAVLETVGLDKCRPEPLADFEVALQRFEAKGAIITRLPIPAISRAMEIAGCLFVVEAYAQWGKTIEANPDTMYSPVQRRFEAGRKYSGVEYVRRWKEMKQIRAEYTALVAGYDAVLLPSSAILPPDRERLLNDDEYFIAENLVALNNTRIANLMGLCALTLPTDTPGCGIMAMGAPLGEARLLRLGVAMEAAL
ncbi:MAG: amidase [Rhodobacteraceae bacterium]|nr:amidase [Paracoccaceae bacterium]